MISPDMNTRMADNYFVCTLGQAIQHPKTNARSIPEFLELQAEKYGQRPAIGFPGLTQTSTCVLTFLELNEQTKEAARGLINLEASLKNSLGQGRTAALLAQSHVRFIKTWLGLIRLGFSVLLLATQLDKASIQHLCGERDVEYLFHDDDHAKNAMEVEGVTLVHLRPDELARGRRDDPEIEFQIGPQGKVCSVPYLHHSSGTSSGKPKAISQTNAGAFAALPSIDMSPGVATFSSTPLYHGGVADCFRAWTSGQMIWLFPGGQKAITAQTVLGCLSVADEHFANGSTDPVQYFSSVPYVLRDLAANDEGMEILRRMDIVGVGGAAFPTTLGQKLVSEGVNLVSRYGSAECGFLLSSYRNFKKDTDWDHLRSDTGAEHLVFELQDSGLYELVVKPGWPHIAKTNREDGSYATADLLEKHPTKPNAWRYHSRADTQITLVNGKKFDPEPIESAIVSKCHLDLVLDAFIFGDGESYPGALIFARKGPDSSPENLLDQIWPTVNEVNRNNPSHARLSKGTIRVVYQESEGVPPLEKSSKGTILRGIAHERYHDQIRKMYEGQTLRSDMEYSIRSNSDVIVAITRIIETTTGKPLAHDEDFFEQGVDSIDCIQIRKEIQNLVASLHQRLKHDAEASLAGDSEGAQLNGLETSPWFRTGGELPSNLLYDCGTVEVVAAFLLGQPTSGQDSDIRLMNELAIKYSNFDMPNISADSLPARKDKGLVVLLTGATGALGTHLLDVLRSRSDVERIYCLLRASDPFVAYQRVDKALKSKAKEGLQPIGAIDKKIVCLQCNLAQPNLGLDESILRVISSTVDVIIHSAWAVNFTLRLRSFEFHLAGVQNLLNLGFAAAHSDPPSTPGKDLGRKRVKFLFCSSIASVVSSSSEPVAETISEEPFDASPLGYSRSKWVAESMCVKAHQAAQGAGISLDVEILRIGQLCGDTDNGIWNKTEAWPLMLSTFDVIGCLPNLPNEELRWLPLDVAANAIREVAFNNAREEGLTTDPPVYHILNPHSTTTWAEMLHWLREREGDRLHIAAPATWLQSLGESLTAHYPNHPSRKLLGLWKDTYLSRHGKVDKTPEFEVTRAAESSNTMGNVEPVSRELVEKMWNWIRSSMQADNEGAR
jgi:thioester reductase-like protein